MCRCGYVGMYVESFGEMLENGVIGGEVVVLCGLFDVLEKYV